MLYPAVPKTTTKSRRLSVSHESCLPNVATTTKRPKIELEDEDKHKEANLTANKLLSNMFFPFPLKGLTNELNAGQFLTDNDRVSLAVLRVSVWWQSAYCNCATLQDQEESVTHMRSLNNYGYLISVKMMKTKTLKKYDNHAYAIIVILF